MAKRAQFRLIGVMVALTVLPVLDKVALAQDPSGTMNPSTISVGGASDGSAGTTVPPLNVHRGNPLEDLFTPKPQFPTAQTLYPAQPTAPPAGELNPLKGLFTPQPQFPTPQSLQNPDGKPADGEVNHLDHVFTPDNQWATPQTVLNPEPIPRALVPERQFLYGSDEERKSLLRESNLNTFGTETAPTGANSFAPQLVPKLKPAQTPGKNSQANNVAKSSSVAGLHAKPTVALVGASSASTASGVKPILSPEQQKAATELKSAVAQMRLGQNADALDICDRVLRDRPGDAQAHYVKAVALVNLRRYKDASAEYNDVLHDATPGDRLGDLARSGLKKIGY